MNLTIRKRLLLSTAATLAFVGIVGWIGTAAVHTLDVSMDAISTNGVAMKDQLQADQAHDALRADVLAALLASSSANTAQLQEAAKAVAEHTALFRKLMGEMDAQAADGGLRQSMAKVKPDVEAYLASAAEMVRLAGSDAAAAQAKFDSFMQDFRKLETSMADLSDRIEKDSDAAKTIGDDAVVNSRYQIIGVALLSMLISLVAGLVIARSIVRPLDEAIGFAASISDGDLAADLKHDERDRTETGRLKQALAAMRTSLRGIVSQVRDGTETMATASEQIAAGNLDLSSRTETQASSLQETASSMEELTSTVKQNADNARQANQLAASASDVAVRGGTVVSQVVDTMGAIHDASRKIVDIIGVIEGIAFQTNILALNAAVEAARAGEQGRGFAVVASEVRNLAQRSNSAAKEIKELIGASVSQVDAGSRLVGEAGATMGEIVDSVRRVTDIMSEITAATREQETGIDQINQAIVEIDNATQQNAALVEEAAAAAGSMREQAGKLAELVSVFKLGGDSAVLRQAARSPRPRAVARSKAPAIANEGWESL